VIQTWHCNPAQSLPSGYPCIAESAAAASARFGRLNCRKAAGRTQVHGHPGAANAAANEFGAPSSPGRQLRHPNLVRIDQVWCQPGYVVVAMDWPRAAWPTGSTATKSSTRPVPPEVCASICLQAADRPRLPARRSTLRRPARGLPHCDCKPGNLLSSAQMSCATTAWLRDDAGVHAASAPPAVASPPPECFMSIPPPPLPPPPPPPPPPPASATAPTIFLAGSDLLPVGAAAGWPFRAAGGSVPPYPPRAGPVALSAARAAGSSPAPWRPGPLGRCLVRARCPPVARNIFGVRRVRNPGFDAARI